MTSADSSHDVYDELLSVAEAIATDIEANALLCQIQTDCALLPILFSQRTKILNIMSLLLDKFPDIKHSSDTKALRARLGFSYLPPLSAMPRADSLVNNTISITPKTVTARNSSVVSEKNGAVQTHNPFNLVPCGHALKCTVHRVRFLNSGIRPYYKMYINSEENDDLTKLTENNFLMGSRKVSSGLSFQYLLWSASDVKEWKEKNSFSKLIKYGSVFFGKLNSPESYSNFPGSGKVAIIMRSVDKVVHVSVAISAPNDPTSDASLGAAIEVNYDLFVLKSKLFINVVLIYNSFFSHSLHPRQKQYLSIMVALVIHRH